MKRDFRAIDAIAYAFGYGFTGQLTLFRLGWLSVVLQAFGFYLLLGSVGAVESVIAPFASTLAGDGEAGASLARLWNGFDDHRFTGEMGDLSGLFQFYALSSLAGLLFVPAYTAMIRQSAGASARSGFLPLFGRAELYLLVGTIIAYALLAAAVLVLAIAGVAAIAAGAELLPRGDMLIVAVTVPGAGLCGLVSLWLFLRLVFLPGHAAITERLTIGQALSLVGGRFWKLLGTLLLFAILLGLLSAGFQFGVLTLLSSELVVPALVLHAAIALYVTAAQFGFYGRILGDLIGLPAQAGPNGDTETEEENSGEDGWTDAETDGLGDAREPVSDFRHGELSGAPQDRPVMRRNAPPVTESETPLTPQPTRYGEAEEAEIRRRSSIGFLRYRFRG